MYELEVAHYVALQEIDRITWLVVIDAQGSSAFGIGLAGPHSLGSANVSQWRLDRWPAFCEATW